MAANSASSTAWLARLQQQFLEGKHTDMVIRVRIDKQQELPAAKRARTAEVEEEQKQEAGADAPAAGAAGAAAANATGAGDAPAAATAPADVAAAASGAAAGDGEFTDIKAHSLVLRTRSAYIDRALSGEWIEAADRRVELVVEDEQAMEDVKLLIKLSYLDSYAHDSGQLLPIDTRLRLAARADGLEFVDAVEQVAASLAEGLDFDGAIQCASGLPPALEEHPSMAATRKKMAVLLAKGIEEREWKAGQENVRRLEAGLEAYIKCLASGAGVFDETVEGLIEGTRPLRDDVRGLSLGIFRQVLASDALRLQTENEVYALLCAWLQQSPHASYARRNNQFKELAPLVRYHHMTADFLANVILPCPMMEGSGLLPVVMRSAIVQREASAAALKESARGRPNRCISPSEAAWEVKATFTLKELAAVKPGNRLSKWCGLVAGYPAELSIERRIRGTLGIFLRVRIPKPEARLAGSAEGGVCLRTDWTLSPNINKSFSNLFKTQQGRGWNDVFAKPWAEVVREGSPHFPGGKLEIKVLVKLALKD